MFVSCLMACALCPPPCLLPVYLPACSFCLPACLRALLGGLYTRPEPHIKFRKWSWKTSNIPRKAGRLQEPAAAAFGTDVKHQTRALVTPSSSSDQPQPGDSPTHTHQATKLSPFSPPSKFPQSQESRSPAPQHKSKQQRQSTQPHQAHYYYSRPLLVAASTTTTTTSFSEAWLQQPATC